MEKNSHDRFPEGEIEQERQQNKERWVRLHSFCGVYSVAQFMEDLNAYFEGEVDFNMEIVRDWVSKPGKLEELVRRAEEQGTHPVSEFVKDMIRESAQG